MKFPRILLTILLVAAISACSSLPPLPLGPTATPPATLTPTVTPTFTPTPTPIPAIRIESGDRAFFNGDYDAARAEYQQAFNGSQDADTRAESLWGLARTEFEAGDLNAANAFLEQLTREHPGHVRAEQAHFLLGESYGELNRFAEAAGAIRRVPVGAAKCHRRVRARTSGGCVFQRGELRRGAGVL
jgi:hypothetical protein